MSQNSSQQNRWQQRLNSFNRAFEQLEEFIDKGKLNKFEIQGLIQCFEYNYEIGWKLLKDYLEYQGNNNITGARSSINESFKLSIIEDGQGWLEMMIARNKSSHTYNIDTTNEISEQIYNKFYPLLQSLKEKFNNLS